MRNVRSIVLVGMVAAMFSAGLGGCLTSDAPLERGWGRALAMVPGADGVWGVHAQDGADAEETTVALVEWLGDDTSGRVIQGVPDGLGGRVVQIDTPEGTWSAAVDANGEVLWSDPLPDDPWALAGAVADAGLALERQDDSCATCTASIGFLAIAVAVGVVGAAAVALWTAFRDPPGGGRPSPAKPAPTSRSSSGAGSTQRPHIDCGPRPEGDVRADPEARRKYFEWMQCMAQASR